MKMFTLVSYKHSKKPWNGNQQCGKKNELTTDEKMATAAAAQTRSTAKPTKHVVPYAAMLLLIVSVSKATAQLEGTPQTCENEGKDIPVNIPDAECYRCFCTRGYVRCVEKSCPSLAECYVLEEKTPNMCCNKCKGCIFRGVTYDSGSKWTDLENPCKSYTCVSSIVTETIMKCYAQCDTSQLTAPKPGECCPKCQGCEINGQKVFEGQELATSINGTCLVCQCTENKLKCSKKACPVLQCPISEQKLDPKECCPYCTKKRQFTLPADRCFWSDEVFKHENQFMPDNCTNCTCTNGTSICERKTCPILECSAKYQELDGCCRSCKTSDIANECIQNGISYQNNESWKLEPCHSCHCIAGNIRCTEMHCPPIDCDLDEELKDIPGECCPKCIKKDARCTVFGDSHFITFDGRFYNFEGSCQYVLAKDHSGRSFFIRLMNDAHKKSVSLKMRGTTVGLRQEMLVKVNGSKVMLPYSQGPITEIERLTETIMVKTELGLNIEWDGKNYLQITVESSFKGRLSGLCGNYNDRAKDDLTDRNGTIHTKVLSFASSWKAASRKNCSEKITKYPYCKQKGKNMSCILLFSSELFSKCRDSLNTRRYSDFCKRDCKCYDSMCHCNTFAAYARECQRLGAISSDWRKSTNCTYNNINYAGLEL